MQPKTFFLTCAAEFPAEYNEDRIATKRKDTLVDISRVIEAPPIENKILHSSHGRRFNWVLCNVTEESQCAARQSRAIFINPNRRRGSPVRAGSEGAGCLLLSFGSRAGRVAAKDQGLIDIENPALPRP